MPSWRHHRDVGKMPLARGGTVGTAQLFLRMLELMSLLLLPEVRR
jgi:hypothetical protein